MLSREMIEPLVIGGSILGGGGGGSMERGRKMANLAFDLGSPRIVDISDLKENDVIFTVSSVGAPAAKSRFVQPIDYMKAVNRLEEISGITPKAFITNENGGSATVNGFIQSAILDIPILDAPCNGRAHPTGVLGSMNLTEKNDYTSMQSAVGGRPGTVNRVSLVVEGSIESTSTLVRQSAIEAGGLVAVARNPVPVSYVKEHAAIGAFTQAYEMGLLHEQGITPMDKVERVLDKLSGKVICQGTVNNLSLDTVNGFDLGSFFVLTESDKFQLTFWNEYMTCDINEKRLSTFPDLLMTFSSSNGMPVTSAELNENDEIIVSTVPYANLLLGGGMFTKSNYNILEKTLNKEIINYIQPLFSDDR